MLKGKATILTFIGYVMMINQMYHNIDIVKVTRYYLKGVNLNDSDGIKQRISNFNGDFLYKCPTYKFARLYTNNSNKASSTFFYQLDYALKFQNRDYGVYHTAELPFVFGSPILNQYLYTQSDQSLSTYIINLWTGLAKTG